MIQNERTTSRLSTSVLHLSKAILPRKKVKLYLQDRTKFLSTQDLQGVFSVTCFRYFRRCARLNRSTASRVKPCAAQLNRSTASISSSKNTISRPEPTQQPLSATPACHPARRYGRERPPPTCFLYWHTRKNIARQAELHALLSYRTANKE